MYLHSNMAMSVRVSFLCSSIACEYIFLPATCTSAATSDGRYDGSCVSSFTCCCLPNLHREISTGDLGNFSYILHLKLLKISCFARCNEISSRGCTAVHALSYILCTYVCIHFQCKGHEVLRILQASRRDTEVNMASLEMRANKFI